MRTCRSALETAISNLTGRTTNAVAFPSVAITGPRNVGKTHGMNRAIAQVQATHPDVSFACVDARERATQLHVGTNSRAWVWVFDHAGALAPGELETSLRDCTTLGPLPSASVVVLDTPPEDAVALGLEPVLAVPAPDWTHLSAVLDLLGISPQEPGTVPVARLFGFFWGAQPGLWARAGSGKGPWDCMQWEDTDYIEDAKAFLWIATEFARTNSRLDFVKHVLNGDDVSQILTDVECIHGVPIERMPDNVLVRLRRLEFLRGWCFEGLSQTVLPTSPFVAILLARIKQASAHPETPTREDWIRVHGVFRMISEHLRNSNDLVHLIENSRHA